MGIKKIAFIQLDHLVRSGKSVSEIARQLNITKGAVSKALKRLNVAVTKDISSLPLGKGWHDKVPGFVKRPPSPAMTAG